MNNYYNSNKYSNIKKSKLTPPNYVFGIVWPILYLLLGISFLIIFFENKQVLNIGLIVFLIHLFFNFIWTYLFINYDDKRIALIDLIIVLILIIYCFSEFIQINKIGGLLLVPYIIWLCFAFYLNLFIVINN